MQDPSRKSVPIPGSSAGQVALLAASPPADTMRLLGRQPGNGHGAPAPAEVPGVAALQSLKQSLQSLGSQEEVAGIGGNTIAEVIRRASICGDSPPVVPIAPTGGAEMVFGHQSKSRAATESAAAAFRIVDRQLLRGTPVNRTIRKGGLIFRNNEGSAETFELSEPVASARQGLR